MYSYYVSSHIDVVVPTVRGINQMYLVVEISGHNLVIAMSDINQCDESGQTKCD